MVALRHVQLPCPGVVFRTARIHLSPCRDSRPKLRCRPVRDSLENDPISNPDFDDLKLDEKYWEELGIDEDEREAQQTWDATDVDPEGSDVTLDNLFDDDPGAADWLDALPQEKAYGPKALLLAGLQSEEVAATRAIMDAVGAHDVKVVTCTPDMLHGTLDAALAVPEPLWELPRSGDASQTAGWGAQRVCMFAGLSLKAVATAVELLEESGLPPLCAAFAMAEDARRPLGELLAEAVKEQRGRKNPEKELWESAQRAADNLPDVQNLIRDATNDRLKELDQAAADGRLEELLAQGAIDMSPQEAAELEGKMQDRQQPAQHQQKRDAAQPATAAACAAAEFAAQPDSSAIDAPSTADSPRDQLQANAPDQTWDEPRQATAAEELPVSSEAATSSRHQAASQQQQQPPRISVRNDLTAQASATSAEQQQQQQQRRQHQPPPPSQVHVSAIGDTSAGEAGSEHQTQAWQPKAQPQEQRQQLLRNWRFVPPAAMPPASSAAVPADSSAQHATPNLEASTASPLIQANGTTAEGAGAPKAAPAASKRRLYQQPAGPVPPPPPPPPAQQPTLAELQAAAVAARRTQQQAAAAPQVDDDDLFWAKLMLVSLEMQQEARTQQSALEQPAWEGGLDWKAQLAQIQSDSKARADKQQHAEAGVAAAQAPVAPAPSSAAPTSYRTVAASEFNIIDLIAEDPLIDVPAAASSPPTSNGDDRTSNVGIGSTASDALGGSATAAGFQSHAASEQQACPPSSKASETQLSRETIELVKEAGGDPEQLRRMIDEAAAAAAARKVAVARTAQEATAAQSQERQSSQQQSEPRQVQPQSQQQPLVQQTEPQPSAPQPPTPVPWVGNAGPSEGTRTRPNISRKSTAAAPSSAKGFARRRPGERSSRVTPMTMEEMQALGDKQGKRADGWMMDDA